MSQPVSFAKGSFCGVCKKSANDIPADKSLKTCGRCQIAKYCSQECQKEDFASHKKDCKWVGHFHDMMPILEENYRTNWGRNDMNLFETHVGRFCIDSMNNRLYWDPPKSNDLKDVWPRDYMRRRCRMAEGMWEIAKKHESFEATEIVLKEVLATLRLDFEDRYAVKEMAVFMFLYLGKYVFLKHCL